MAHALLPYTPNSPTPNVRGLAVFLSEEDESCRGFFWVFFFSTIDGESSPGSLFLKILFFYFPLRNIETHGRKSNVCVL